MANGFWEVLVLHSRMNAASEDVLKSCGEINQAIGQILCVDLPVDQEHLENQVVHLYRRWTPALTSLTAFRAIPLVQQLTVNIVVDHVRTSSGTLSRSGVALVNCPDMTRVVPVSRRLLSMYISWSPCLLSIMPRCHWARQAHEVRPQVALVLNSKGRL